MIRKIFSAGVFMAPFFLFSQPLLRVGLVSDTHVTAEKSSCRLLEQALKLFKKHNAELIVNAGDIANRYDPAAYKNYRETVNAVYSGSAFRPKEIFAYANHDWMGKTERPVWEVFKEVKKHLDIPHDPYDVLKLKGYTFVIIPQFADMKRYKAMLDKAVRENPGKVVFVVDHVPPHDTVFASAGQGLERRKLLDHYPSVVLLCGHKHNCLKSELGIWQGNFTVVHCGCFQNWRPHLTGAPWYPLKSDMVLLLDIYPDRLVFRRYSVSTQKEFKPDARWILPLPFDKKTAPYRPAYRRKTAPVPQFPPQARITEKISGKNIVFTFPHARSRDGVYQYRIELFRKEKGKQVLFARHDTQGNFLNTDAVSAQYSLDIGYFSSGTDCTLRVTPVNFWHAGGKFLEKTFSIPQQKKYTVCFESRDPQKDCAFLTGKSAGKPLEKSGKYHIIPAGESVRMVFPGNIWRSKAWTPYRTTIEMELEETSPLPRFMTLRTLDPWDEATGRVLLPKGRSGILRYVLPHSKREDDYNYDLLFSPGGKGKFRITYVKVEVLD